MATIEQARSTLRRVYRNETIRRLGPHEGWHQVGQPDEPPFSFTWSNAVTSLQGNKLDAAPAGFYKDNDSEVWLRGVVQRFAGAYLPMFTLPVGYRPAFTHPLGGDRFTTIEVRPNGEVWLQGEIAWFTAYPNAATVSGNGGGIGVPTRMLLSLSHFHFRAAN